MSEQTRRYKCPACDRTYTEIWDLRFHWRIKRSLNAPGSHRGSYPGTRREVNQRHPDGNPSDPDESVSNPHRGVGR